MARIAIVGAGPAGSSAGWHLAARGHAVTLIDRAAFPRPKTCGDWIPLGAVAELERLGLTPRDLEREAAEYAAIDSTTIVAPNGRQTTSAGRATAYCIPRLVFDDLLWRRAVAAGCTPRRASVRDVARDPELSREFDHVVDARGAHAGTPNAVALRAYWTVKRDRVRDDEVSCVQIHTDAVFRRGYGWIFPVHVQDDTVRINLGVGLWRDDSVPGRDIKDFFARFVETNAVLQRWREDADIGRAVGCHVGLGVRRNVVAGNGVLRIGDAANLADPLTGDGIANALKSGRLAADAIAESASRLDAVGGWQSRHDAVFAPECLVALRLQQALVGTAAKNITAGVLATAPFLRARVHSAFFGETGYREMWRAHRT